MKGLVTLFAVLSGMALLAGSASSGTASVSVLDADLRPSTTLWCDAFQLNLLMPGFLLFLH